MEKRLADGGNRVDFRSRRILDRSLHRCFTSVNTEKWLLPSSILSMTSDRSSSSLNPRDFLLFSRLPGFSVNSIVIFFHLFGALKIFGKERNRESFAAVVNSYSPN